MKKAKPPSSSLRTRKDHYVPQGYLRGFVHPDREKHERPLWVFDIKRGEWSEKSTSQVGWERGYYDYSPGTNPDATADDAFTRLENALPIVRDRIRAEGFESWIRHRGVLVSFVGMVAARSPLCRAQAESQVLSSLAGAPNEQVLAKNYSITVMRTEIERRSKDWQAYHWSLGYTKNPEHPFVASDQAVGMHGRGADLNEAYERNDFWLWCPLSWDMCLIGSSQRLIAEATAELQPEHIAEVQVLTRRQANAFLASPVPLANLPA